MTGNEKGHGGKTSCKHNEAFLAMTFRNVATLRIQVIIRRTY
jgi:hypothetical protein